MDRRSFLGSTLAVSLWGTLKKSMAKTHSVSVKSLGKQSQTDQVRSVGSKKQLFIDDRFVDGCNNVHRTVNSPLSTQVLDIPPLNGVKFNAHFTLLETEGQYRLYYTAMLRTGPQKFRQPYMMCMSKSDNGIDWTHPNVGLFEINGSKQNNVVMPASVGTVFIDPNKTLDSKYWFIGCMSERTAPPFWKESENTYYRTLFDDQGQYYHEGALYLMHSKDGLVWKRIKEPALPFWCDTQNQCFYDARIGKYVGYFRGNNPPRMAKRRNVRRTETDALLDLPWPYAENPQRQRGPAGLYGDLIDELPEVMGPDGRDPEASDLYTPCVNPYPWAEDVYFSFPLLYRHYTDQNSYGRDTRGQDGNSGPLDVQLAVSRDGMNFHRFRTPYMSPGLLEEDSGGGAMFMGVGMVKRGNYIYQYFKESAFPHTKEAIIPGREDAKNKKLGLAIHRLDGFVSMDTGPAGGELVTPPVVFTGNRLNLNINCFSMGQAWVGLQDVVGRPIEGFTLKDAVSVDRNGLAQEVWWKKGSDVSQLAGQPIRLNIKMHSAKLYGFQFVNAQA